MNIDEQKNVESEILMEKIISGNYIITEEDFQKYPTLSNNREIMKIAIDQNPSFIRYININEIDHSMRKSTSESIVNMAIERGYIPEEEDFLTNNSLGSSPSLIMHAVNINPNFIKYKKSFSHILGWHNDEEKVFNEAIEHGYVPTEEDLKNYSELRSSSVIMKKAIEIDPFLIKYFTGHFGESGMLENYALEHGYVPTKEDILNNNELGRSLILMKKFIEIDPALFKYAEMNYDKLEELSKYAIECGYVLSRDDLEFQKYFLGVPTLMMKAIDIDPKYILQCFGPKFNSDIFKYAIEKGYIPTKEDVEKNSIFRKNDDIMEILININPEFYELYFFQESDDNKLFELAISCGYSPTFEKIKNKRELLDNSFLCQYLIENDPYLYNVPFFKELSKHDFPEGFNITTINDVWHFINCEDVYKCMSFDDMVEIIKYIYCNEGLVPNVKIKMDEVINTNKFKELNMIIDKIYMPETIIDKILIIIDIIDNYCEYYNLCCDILKSDITPRDKYLLKLLLINKNNNNFELNNIEDLSKYDEKIYRERLNKINLISDDDHWEIEEQILNMLLNMNSEEYSMDIDGFSSKKISELQKNIKSYQAQKELEKYKIAVEFVENILSIEDTKKLKLFAIKLNEALYMNNNLILNIYDMLSDINRIKRYYYGLEIQEKMTDISNLLETTNVNLENQSYIRKNEKYECPNIELYGENLGGKKIDYIELNGMSFSFFIHRLNAYGKDGSLKDVKKSKFSGKTYICLTPIADFCPFSFVDKQRNEYETTADSFEQEIKKANNVKLVYSKIAPEQFFEMSNTDLNSYGGSNSFAVELTGLVYRPLNDNLKSLSEELKNVIKYEYPELYRCYFDKNYDKSDINLTECLNEIFEKRKQGKIMSFRDSHGRIKKSYLYCEYLFNRDYREENIYPSAVLCDKKEPSASEIIAAAYLNIPLLYINEKYLKEFISNFNLDSQNEYEDEYLNFEIEENLRYQLEEFKESMLQDMHDNSENISSGGRK